MTATERQRRYRRKLRRSQPDPKTLRKQARRAERERELADRIERERQRLPDMPKIYGVILADPAARFEPWSRETGMDRAADNHYPTSPTDSLARLVPPAASNAVLFLWATAPMLAHALRIIEAWGFEYRTHLVWRKDRIITGYWARFRHELLLIAVRGEVPAPAPGAQPESVIDAALGAHSEKPADFHQIIEELYPSVPKLEMFARSGRPGWDSWGAEAPELADADAGEI